MLEPCRSSLLTYGKRDVEELTVNFELRKAALCFSLEANVILSKAFVPLHLGIRCFSSHAVQQHSMNSVPGENFNLLDVLIALDCLCVSVNVAGQIAHF